MTQSKLAPTLRRTIVSAPSSRKNFFRVAEFCFALAMRIVPNGYRFAVALFIARATVPFFCKTAAYREQEIKNFHEPSEIVLYLLLNALTKNRTPYDLEIAVTGYEHFERAYSKGKGVLTIGHHAALTLLMVRFFHSKDLNPVVITPDPQQYVAGTLSPMRTLQPSAMFLVQLRTRLRRGELVCAMPDRAEHHDQRTVEFATPAGQVIIAPAIIQVAGRCGAEVIFAEVRVAGSKLVATLEPPRQSSAANASALTADFISFVRERTAEIPAADRRALKTLHHLNSQSPAEASERLR